MNVSQLWQICAKRKPRLRLSIMHLLTTRRYKPDLKLRFITEELGFESDEHSARFICDHGGQAFLEGQGDDIKLSTSKSLSLFESARKVAFQKVDIKGQI